MAFHTPLNKLVLLPTAHTPHINTLLAWSLQASHQGPAVIGLALIAMAEPLGAQMAGRALEHLLQVGRGV